MQCTYKSGLLLILSLLLSWEVAQADRVSSALKQIQKGEYGKARVLLEKELEKDSLSAGVWHIFAVYYFEKDNASYDLDSAYWSVRKSLGLYPGINEKDSASWAKDQISITSAQELKVAIETEAYQRAWKANSVEDYQFFIQGYSEARELKRAIISRDSLAWQATQSTNSLQAYQQFIQQYPQSLQLAKAQERRDYFIYQENTQSDRMSDIERFVQNYPENQYKDSALVRLLDYYGLIHEANSYAKFLDTYPHSAAQKEASAWLFMLSLPEAEKKPWASLYPDYAHDWMDQENTPLYPMYEPGKGYGFINSKGQVAIIPRLDYVFPEYLCEGEIGDFVIQNRNGRLGLLDRLGNEICSPQYDKIEALAPGLFRVTLNAFQGVLCFTGELLLPTAYDRIELLPGPYLKVRKNRRWGLLGLLGQELLPHEYAEITAPIPGLIALKKGDQYALLSQKEIFARYAEKMSKSILFEYNQLEALDSSFVLGQSKGAFGVLDLNKDWVLPPQYSQVEMLGNSQAWAAYLDSAWQIFSSDGQLLYPEPVEDYQFYSEKLCLKKEGKWGLIALDGESLLDFKFDSLQILDNLVIKRFGKKVKIQSFAEDAEKEIDLSYFRKLRPEPGSEWNEDIFLHFEDRFGRVGMVDQRGKILFAPKYKSAYPIDNSLLNVELNGRYGLIDRKAQVVLPIYYQGLTNMQGNEVCKITFYNGKFGIYNYLKRKKINAVYETRPQAFGLAGDTSFLFIVQKKGRMGLISLSNQNLIPFQYEEVMYWKDSTALVLSPNGNWKLHPFGSQGLADTLSENMQEVSWLQKDSDLRLLKAQVNQKYGIWSSSFTNNLLLPPEFDNIWELGSGNNRVFLTLKKGESSNNSSQIAYYNLEGQKIWEQTLPQSELHQLICEEE